MNHGLLAALWPLSAFPEREKPDWVHLPSRNCPSLEWSSRLTSLPPPSTPSSPHTYVKTLLSSGCHTASATSMMTGYEKQWTGSPAENEVHLQTAAKRRHNRKSLAPVNILEGSWFLKACLRKETYSSSNIVFQEPRIPTVTVLLTDDKAELSLAIKCKHLLSEWFMSNAFGSIFFSFGAFGCYFNLQWKFVSNL